ncbi:MAG: hypothetical protein WBY53_15840, partial [Acidobacteriaceae bacterium]
MTTQFGTSNPARSQVTITGNTPTLVPTACYVQDQITFQAPSQLLFHSNDQSADQTEFAIICRKLVVIGGKAPTDSNPCNPGEPGSRYGNTNLISWDGRLTAAPNGPSIPPQPAQSAGTGLAGLPGLPGNSGVAGLSPVTSRKGGPAKLVIVAIEVEVVNGGNLVVDWAGQNGGDGGDGQIGGNGGSGTTGNNGSDASWPSSGCGTATG